jgi:hypothetical protein
MCIMSKAALCVGINNFEHLPQSSWLQGCVNDAEDLAGLLEAQYGFPGNAITILVDARATRKTVMAELIKLMDLAVSGNVRHLVFTFSGHGTRIPDVGGDGAFDLDALACYDIHTNGDTWETDTIISKHDLFDLWSRLPEGVLLEVILDTCHSGTGLKSLDLLPGRRPRFVPPPTPRSTVRFAVPESRGLRNPLNRGGSTLFAACRADQTAADALLDGRYNGAFTYNFVKSLKSDAELPRAELLRLVSKGLKAGGFDQVAQFTGTTASRKTAWGS